MIESGLVAQSSLNGVMNGHHHNRSMRAHKITYEALRRLQWEVYMDSLNEEELTVVNDTINKLATGFHNNDILGVVSSESFTGLATSFTEFNKKISKESPTVAFWMSYMEMVENVLLLTRATRTGNWELHVSAVRNILPWMFAYDRPNYARYLSAYYLEMCDLPQTHPIVHKALATGEFAVQRQESRGFAQVECDMCKEQTCNREAKTKGGIVGFTINTGAVMRWLLTQHESSAITNECKAMAGKVENSRTRKDLDKAMITTVRSMINPFDEEGDELLHLSSGVVAPGNVQNGLLQAHSHGNKAFVTFARDRLQSQCDTSTFFQPIKRQNLPTFGVKKKTVTKVKGKRITLEANRKLFARLMLIGKSRDINLREMLSYCLGPVPLPLATQQGTLIKTNKATLL